MAQSELTEQKVFCERSADLRVSNPWHPEYYQWHKAVRWKDNGQL